MLSWVVIVARASGNLIERGLKRYVLRWSPPYGLSASDARPRLASRHRPCFCPSDRRAHGRCSWFSDPVRSGLPMQDALATINCNAAGLLYVAHVLVMRRPPAITQRGHITVKLLLAVQRCRWQSVYLSAPGISTRPTLPCSLSSAWALFISPSRRYSGVLGEMRSNLNRRLESRVVRWCDFRSH